MLLDFLHLSTNRYVYFRNRASKVGISVSNPGFPEPETRVFSTTKPGYFKKPGIAVAFKY